MPEPIVINGKKFITSKQAAALTGYARDYVGQLVRMGKVKGQVIDKTLFVSEESLLAHVESKNANSKVVENSFKNAIAENVAKATIPTISPRAEALVAFPKLTKIVAKPISVKTPKLVSKFKTNKPSVPVVVARIAPYADAIGKISSYAIKHAIGVVAIFTLLTTSYASIKSPDIFLKDLSSTFSFSTKIEAEENTAGVVTSFNNFAKKVNSDVNNFLGIGLSGTTIVQLAPKVKVATTTVVKEIVRDIGTTTIVRYSAAPTASIVVDNTKNIDALVATVDNLKNYQQNQLEGIFRSISRGRSSGATTNTTVINNNAEGTTTLTNLTVTNTSTSTISKLEVTSSFTLNGETIIDFVGAGLDLTNGVLSATAGAGFSTTSADYHFDNRIAATTTLNNLTTLRGLTDLVTVNATTTTFALGSDYITDLTGAGLTIVNGALTVSGASGFSTTSADYWETQQTRWGTTTDSLAFDARLAASTSIPTITTLAGLSLPITQTTGTLSVARGGTGQTAFTQGWLSSDGVTLTSSTSPTVNYITATSTTATSTFPNLSLTNLVIGSDFISDITGSGLSIVNGALTLDPSFGWATTSDTFSFNTLLAATTTLNNLTTLRGLTDIISTRATTTNATTTNLFATTASTTNLFVNGNASIGTSSQNGSLTIERSDGTNAIYLSRASAGFPNMAFNFSNSIPTIQTSGGILNVSSGLTDATSKTFRLSYSHYNAVTSGQVCAIMASSDITASSLGIGGGSVGCNAPTNIVLYTGATNTTLSGTAGFLMDNLQNVGIGSVVPTAKLHIVGRNGSTTDLFKVASSTSAEFFTIKSTGNIGIGSTSPYARLSVVGQTVAEYFTATSTTATSTLPLLSTNALSLNGQYVTSFWGTTTDSLAFDARLAATTSLPNLTSVGLQTNLTFTNATGSNLYLTSLDCSLYLNGGKLTTDSNGRVTCANDSTGSGGGGGGTDVNWTYFNGSGISVSTTSNQVVIGASATSSLQKLQVSGGAYFTGTVGIGTTSPAEVFAVNGNVLIAGAVKSSIFTATSTTATSTFPNLSLTNLVIGSDFISDITGSGLSIVNGALTVNSASIFSTTSVDYWETQQTRWGTTTDSLAFDARLAASTSIPTITTLAGLSLPITQTTGTLSVARGGTGQTAFTQGWLSSDGVTLTSSTSPTVNYITATSTTATSTLPLLSTNALSLNGQYVTSFWGTTTDSLAFDARLAATTTLPNLAILRGLTDIISTRATTTNATSTNFFATTASSTNLYTSKLSVATTSQQGAITVQVTGAENALFLGRAGTANNLAVTFEAGRTNFKSPSGFFNLTNAFSINQVKQGLITVGSYDDVTYAPRCFGGAQDTGTIGPVFIGGGFVECLAATSIDFYASENASTTIGSLALRITGGGNVGIGTTTPYQKLSVNGSAVINGSVLTSIFTATSTTATSTFPNLSLTNLVIGSDFISDITGANLSIINGALTATDLTFSTTSADYWDTTKNRWATTSDSYAFGVNLSATTSLARLGTLTGLSTIGSSSALTTVLGNLNVQGTVAMNGATISSNTGLVVQGAADAGAGAYAIRGNAAGSNTTFGILGYDDSTNCSSACNVAGIYAQASVGHAIYTAASGSATGGYFTAASGNALEAYTTDGYGLSVSSINSRGLSVTGSTYSVYAAGGQNYFEGNVGVGTTTPYAKLSVNGDAVVAADVLASIFTATSTTATSTFPKIESTLINSGKIIVQGNLNANDNLIILDGGDDYERTISFNESGVQDGYLSYDHNFGDLKLWNREHGGISGDIIFGVRDTERFRMTYTGNFGIGTSSPYARLSVAGQTVSEYFTATSTTATSTFPKLTSTFINLGSDTINDFTGTGLTNIGGALTVDGASFVGTGTLGQVPYFAGAGSALTATSSLYIASTSWIGMGTSMPQAGLHVSVPSRTGYRENFIKFSTTDVGNDAGYLSNGSVLDGNFITTLTGYTESSALQPSLNLRGITSAANDVSDSSNFGIVDILSVTTDDPGNPNNGTLSSVTNRKILTVRGGIGSTNDIKFAILANGNVGIGTTTPYARFAVSGQTVSEYFTATSTTATSTFPKLTSTFINLGSDTINDFTGTGLTNIGGALTVDSTLSGLVTIGSTTGRTNLLGYIGISSSTPSARFAIDTTGLASGDSILSIGSSTRQDFLIANSGNIAIGTSTTNRAKIEITNYSILPTFNIDGSNAGADVFRMYRSDANGGTGGYGLALKIQTSKPSFVFRSAMSSNSEGNIVNAITSDDLIVGGLIISTSTAVTLTNTNIEPFYLKNSTSNIGLAGTSTPWGSVSINGTYQSVGEPTFVVGSSTKTDLIVKQDGTVGIGTTSPISKFTVDGDTWISGTATSSTYNATSTTIASILPLLITTNATSTNLFANTASTTDIFVGGNIDIGTSTGNSRLEIFNNTSAPALSIDAGITGNDIFRIYRGGSNGGTGAGMALTAPSNSPQFQFRTGLSSASGGSGVGTTRAVVSYDSTLGAFVVATSSIATGAIGIEPFFIKNTSSNVGLAGTSTPWGSVSINGTYQSVGEPTFVVGSSTKTDLIVKQDGTVGIGTTTPWRTFSVSGTVAMNGLTTAVGTPSSICMNTATKEITVNAATSCVVSDRDQKQQIQDLTISGLDAIKNIKSVTFAYNDYPDRSRIGFIAQDLQAVDNRLGDAFDKKGIARSIDIPAIMSVTVKAVQELDVKVNAQASTTADQFLAVIGTKPSSADDFLINGDLTFKNKFSVKAEDGANKYLNINSSTGSSVITFTENGNVGIGTTSPAYKLQVIGDIAATAFVNISTIESKTDIKYLTDEKKDNILETLNKMKIAQYRYKSEDKENPLRLGLIAEQAPSEVLSVGGKGVDIYKLSTFTLAAVQAQQKQIQSIDTRLAALEAKVASSTMATTSESMLASLISGIKNLFLDELTVGTKDKATGITLFDEETGEPYCIKMSGGNMKSTSGACGTVIPKEEVKEDPKPTPAPTSTSDDTATSTATSTPVVQASSTPSTDSSSTSAPETSTTEAPKEEPKTEAPKVEEKAPEATPTPTPTPETSTTEAPKEEPKTEAPKVEEKAPEEPKEESKPAESPAESSPSVDSSN